MHKFVAPLIVVLLFPCSALAFYDFDTDWYETGVVGDGWADAATTVGDVNGDGYSDILIASPQFGGSPYWSKGKISLYYGSATGPGSSPDWEYSVNIAFQQLGHSVAPAGDMNADGYADFVVSAPYYSNGHSAEGRLYFFRGSATGPVLAANAEINEEDAWLGFGLAFAGDVNGDGYDDVIAGAPGWGGYGSPFYIPVQGAAYVYYGGATIDGNHDWSKSGGDTDGEFGWSVAGLGDVNGDGYSDVMIGQPKYDTGLFNNNYGRVTVHYGSATGLSSTIGWSQTGPNIGDEFGTAVAFAGDFNGDGFADALIGVPDYNGGNGGVYIASGGPSGLGTAALLYSPGISGWGATVSTIGDFNGDGRSDFVVGGGTDDDAWVYFGDPLNGFEERMFGGGEYATLVASAGDVNGDGLGDFLVTDPIELAGAGAVRLYLGGQETNYSIPNYATRLGVNGAAAELGGDIADAGDVDGDGIDDLLVSAPGAGGVGEVYLYYGTTNYLPSSPSWTAVGDGPSGRFGTSISTAGDVNGDGYADIVVSDVELQQVKVFHGSSTGPSTTASWTYTYPGSDEDFGFKVAGGGDINGDGYADIAVSAPDYLYDNGIVRVFFGSVGGIQTNGYIDIDPSGAHYKLGFSLEIVGDTNADGFDDLAMGAPAINSPGDIGRVMIYYGDTLGFKGYSSHLSATEGGTQLGYALAAAGDVNGDGFADFIVSEPLKDVNAIDDGQVRIFYGDTVSGSYGTAWNSNLTQNDIRFGTSLCGIGDPDGNGKSSIAITYWEASSGLTFGRVYEDFNGIVMAQHSAFEFSYDAHGVPVNGVGDLNGDGSPEIAFGLPFDRGMDGEFRVYGPVTQKATLPPSPRARISTQLGDPIALRGLMGLTDDLRFSMTAWLPIGRSHLNIEWNCGEVQQAYDSGIGAWTPSATHVGGTPLSVDPLLSISGGDRIRWRVRTISTNPYVPHGPWLTMHPNSHTLYGMQVIDTITSVESDTPAVATGLEGAFPNPFNPATHVQFTVKQTQDVELMVYNVAGRRVRTLHTGVLEAGTHRVKWDGLDETGRSVASGVYMAVMKTGKESSSLKLTLVK